MVLIFVLFDDAYPEQILLEWSNKYKLLINDYIKKKQKVSNPIQYDIIPVVINPPSGIERISMTHVGFSDEEIEKMYNVAVTKLGQTKFQGVILSPVQIRGFGGYATVWNNMPFINAPLRPPEPFSETDKQKALNSLAAFQNLFTLISHELLHTLGLSGDHVSMGYGTLYLEVVGQNVDPITGKQKQEQEPNFCDFYGNSPDYYAVKLPNNLKILVGQEPTWLNKEESSTGPCLSGIFENHYLKDEDNDGEYEIMYKNNLIGVELQRTLGWVDIDGDGVAELIDPTPYGGYKENTIKTSGTFIGQYAFESLEEVNINGCQFEKIKLSNGEVGITPLKCSEFNSEIVNLYEKIKYGWIKIQKGYGTIFIPRL